MSCPQLCHTIYRVIKKTNKQTKQRNKYITSCCDTQTDNHKNKIYCTKWMAKITEIIIITISSQIINKTKYMHTRFTTYKY